MMRHKRTIQSVLALAAIASLGRVASAAPFEPRLVSKDAKFVLFADVDQARTTVLGKAILQAIVDNPDYADFEQILVDVAGFMPASDITDITFYGKEYGEKPHGALVIRAKYERGALRGGLSLAGGFKAETYGDHEVLSWDDERDRKRVYACMYDANTILMTDEAIKLREAIDVLDEPETSLEQDEKFPRPANKANWLFAAGVDAQSVDGIAENPILSALQRGVIELGEAGDNTVATLSVTTPNAEQGTQLFNMANGGKALIAIASRPRRANPNPDEKAILAGELLSKTTLKQDGASVTATLNLASDRAVELIQQAIERRELEGK